MIAMQSYIDDTWSHDLSRKKGYDRPLLHPTALQLARWSAPTL